MEEEHAMDKPKKLEVQTDGDLTEIKKDPVWKSWLEMIIKPIPDSNGGKGSFQHCINANQDKHNPGGWCKQIERKIEGKKKAKKQTKIDRKGEWFDPSKVGTNTGWDDDPMNKPSYFQAIMEEERKRRERKKAGEDATEDVVSMVKRRKRLQDYFEGNEKKKGLTGRKCEYCGKKLGMISPHKYCQECAEKHSSAIQDWKDEHLINGDGDKPATSGYIPEKKKMFPIQMIAPAYRKWQQEVAEKEQKLIQDYDKKQDDDEVVETSTSDANKTDKIEEPETDYYMDAGGNPQLKEKSFFLPASAAFWAQQEIKRRKLGTPKDYRKRPLVYPAEEEAEKKRKDKDEVVEANTSDANKTDYFVEEIRSNIIYHNKIFPLIGMIAGQVARGVGGAAKKIGPKLLADVGAVGQDMMEQEEEEEQ